MWSIFFLSLSIALGCSFFCSLCEAALLSLTPGQIENMARKNPARARIWRKYREKVDTPISAILILNTSAHTVGATIAGAELSKICSGDSWWMTLFSILFTYAMLQFTEILPKNLGVRFNTAVASCVTTPLALMILIFRPVIWFVHFVNRPFETGEAAPISPLDELSALVKVGKSRELLDTLQVNIMENGAALRQKTAREVMVPVDQITFLSMDQTPESILETISEDPHTRFPIMEKPDSPDSIVGYLNIKELFPYSKNSGLSGFLTGPDFSMNAFRRDVHFVQEGTPLNTLLKHFVKQRAHVLIVQDFSERTLGLITVEDLLEDLLNDDLRDEFESLLPTHQTRTGYGVFTFGGGVPVRTVCETLEIPLSEEKMEAFPNLSRWLLDEIGAIPRANHKILLYDWLFIVRRVRREQIFDVLVMRRTES